MNHIIKASLFFCLVQCSFNQQNNDDPNKSIKIIELGEANCKIYLKHVVWGLTGDNSRTYISLSANIDDTINEPYFRAIDFFYKLDVEKCQLQIYKSDSLQRKRNNKIDVKVFDNNSIDFHNYEENGFENIIYH